MRKGFTNRRCPKCGGNIFVERDNDTGIAEDYHGWYEWCLQCGFRRYLKPTTLPMEEFEVIPAVKELAIV